MSLTNDELESIYDEEIMRLHEVMDAQRVRIELLETQVAQLAEQADQSAQIVKALAVLHDGWLAEQDGHDDDLHGRGTPIECPTELRYRR